MNLKFLVLALLFMGTLACASFMGRGNVTPTSSATEKANSPPLLFVSNFDNASLTGWKREACCDYSVQTVKLPNRASRQAAKFELKKGDRNVQGGKRTELVQKTVPANSERWYGFSLMLPPSWKAEESFEIVAQWHSVPDFALKESWRTPPLYLSVRNQR